MKNRFFGTLTVQVLGISSNSARSTKQMLPWRSPSAKARGEASRDGCYVSKAFNSWLSVGLIVVEGHLGNLFDAH